MDLLRNHRYRYTACCFLAIVGLLPFAAFSKEANKSPTSPAALKVLFDEAWQRQPEARAYSTRLESLQARERVSQSLLPRPLTLEVAGKAERSGTNSNFGAGGTGEYIVGFAIPLWLIGERSSAMALSDAELQRLIKQQASTQLRLAARIRTLFWEFELAKINHELAENRLQNAKTLSQDVQRRFKAGDLSKADFMQAESAVANSEAALAESQANLILAKQNLRSVIGRDITSELLKPAQHYAETLPLLPKNFVDLDQSHPVIQDLIAQVEVASKATALAQAQTRQNPELQLYTSSGRPEVGVPTQQSILLGLKIPFSSSDRVQAQRFASRANQIESEERLVFERDRVLAELDASKAQVESAQIRLIAAKRRAQLSAETRAFFDKSFKFGETDLPTRLRIELEAMDAIKQAAQAEITYLASVSALRQALGLLPE
jgi:cobalt-zinc-cadmium efflux system outer membrane protein